MSSSNLGRLRGASSSSWQLLISMVTMSSSKEGEVVRWGGTERAQAEEAERASDVTLLNKPSPYLEGEDLTLLPKLARAAAPPKHTLYLSLFGPLIPEFESC